MPRLEGTKYPSLSLKVNRSVAANATRIFQILQIEDRNCQTPPSWITSSIARNRCTRPVFQLVAFFPTILCWKDRPLIWHSLSNFYRQTQMITISSIQIRSQLQIWLSRNIKIKWHIKDEKNWNTYNQAWKIGSIMTVRKHYVKKISQDWDLKFSSKNKDYYR